MQTPRVFYNDLKALIIKHEGLKRYPYHCTAGKLTIGVGRNLDDNGIREKEAMYMLYNDLTETQDELRANVPFFDQLSDPRRMALIDMCFALGLPRFLTFKKMLKAISERNYDCASEEILDSKWARQVGERADDVAEMMRVG